METEFKNNYYLLLFFPMDFKVDSSEVRSFKKHLLGLEEFTKNHCDIVEMSMGLSRDIGATARAPSSLTGQGLLGT